MIRALLGLGELPAFDAADALALAVTHLRLGSVLAAAARSSIAPDIAGCTGPPAARAIGPPRAAAALPASRPLTAARPPPRPALKRRRAKRETRSFTTRRSESLPPLERPTGVKVAPARRVANDRPMWLNAPAAGFRCKPGPPSIVRFAGTEPMKSGSLALPLVLAATALASLGLVEDAGAQAKAPAPPAKPPPAAPAKAPGRGTQRERRRRSGPEFLRQDPHLQGRLRSALHGQGLRQEEEEQRSR